MEEKHLKRRHDFIEENEAVSKKPRIIVRKRDLLDFSDDVLLLIFRCLNSTGEDYQVQLMLAQV